MPTSIFERNLAFVAETLQCGGRTLASQPLSAVHGNIHPKSVRELLHLPFPREFPGPNYDPEVSFLMDFISSSPHDNDLRI